VEAPSTPSGRPLSTPSVEEYELPVLKLVCGGDIAGTLPWHVLRTDRLGRQGLWVRLDHGMTHQRERDVVEWNPHGDVTVPALPIPFTERELAAFMIGGGGWFLRNKDEAEFGDNAASAVRAYMHASRLCEGAEAEFGTDDAGVRRAAASLLARPTPNSAHNAGDGPTLVPMPETNGAINSRPVPRLIWQETVVLQTLLDLGYDPLALRPLKNGARSGWPKQSVRKHLVESAHTKHAFTRDIFDKTWKRLRKEGRIKDDIGR
jgi:hypothetical protein